MHKEPNDKNKTQSSVSPPVLSLWLTPARTPLFYPVFSERSGLAAPAAGSGPAPAPPAPRPSGSHQQSPPGFTQGGVPQRNIIENSTRSESNNNNNTEAKVYLTHAAHRSLCGEAPSPLTCPAPPAGSARPAPAGAAPTDTDTTPLTARRPRSAPRASRRHLLLPPPPPGGPGRAGPWRGGPVPHLTPRGVPSARGARPRPARRELPRALPWHPSFLLTAPHSSGAPLPLEPLSCTVSLPFSRPLSARAPPGARRAGRSLSAAAGPAEARRGAVRPPPQGVTCPCRAPQQSPAGAVRGPRSHPGPSRGRPVCGDEAVKAERRRGRRFGPRRPPSRRARPAPRRPIQSGAMAEQGLGMASMIPALRELAG